MATTIKSPKTRVQVADLNLDAPAQSQVVAQMTNFGVPNIQPDYQISKETQEFADMLGAVRSDLIPAYNKFAADDAEEKGKAWRGAFGTMTAEESKKFYEAKIPEHTGVYAVALQSAYGNKMGLERRTALAQEVLKDPNFLINFNRLKDQNGNLLLDENGVPTGEKRLGADGNPITLQDYLNELRAKDLGTDPPANVMSAYDRTMESFRHELRADQTELEAAHKKLRVENTFMESAVAILSNPDKKTLAAKMEGFYNLKKGFGPESLLQVSNTRFNDLTMAVAERFAQEGNVEVVDALIGQRPDGGSLLLTPAYKGKAGQLLKQAHTARDKQLSEAGEKLYAQYAPLAQSGTLKGVDGRDFGDHLFKNKDGKTDFERLRDQGLTTTQIIALQSANQRKIDEYNKKLATQSKATIMSAAQERSLFKVDSNGELQTVEELLADKSNPLYSLIKSDPENFNPAFLTTQRNAQLAAKNRFERMQDERAYEKAQPVMLEIDDLARKGELPENWTTNPKYTEAMAAQNGGKGVTAKWIGDYNDRNTRAKLDIERQAISSQLGDKWDDVSKMRYVRGRTINQIYKDEKEFWDAWAKNDSPERDAKVVAIEKIRSMKDKEDGNRKANLAKLKRERIAKNASEAKINIRELASEYILNHGNKFGSYIPHDPTKGKVHRELNDIVITIGTGDEARTARLSIQDFLQYGVDEGVKRIISQGGPNVMADALEFQVTRDTLANPWKDMMENGSATDVLTLGDYSDQEFPNSPFNRGYQIYSTLKSTNPAMLTEIKDARMIYDMYDTFLLVANGDRLTAAKHLTNRLKQAQIDLPKISTRPDIITQMNDQLDGFFGADPTNLRSQAEPIIERMVQGYLATGASAKQAIKNSMTRYQSMYKQVHKKYVRTDDLPHIEDPFTATSVDSGGTFMKANEQHLDRARKYIAAKVMEDKVALATLGGGDDLDEDNFSLVRAGNMFFVTYNDNLIPHDFTDDRGATTIDEDGAEIPRTLSINNGWFNINEIGEILKYYQNHLIRKAQP